MKAGFKRYFVPASAAIGLLAVAWLAMTHGPMAMPVVKVAEARSGDLHPAVFGIGTVEARLSYAIGPTQAGRLLSVQVDHGDSVKAGQVLAEIDPVDLDERIKSAGLAAQRARLNVESAEALTREAASRFKQAEANAQRYQDLVAKHFVSQEAAESRRNEADIARAALDASKSNLEAIRRDLAKAGSDRDGVARQRANLKLISPTDGIVVAREAEPGNTVVAGQAVLRVMDPASLWVRARMDQSSSRGLQPGLPAEIVLRSRQDVALKGRVVRVEIQSDSLTEERLVNVAFDQKPGEIFIGELAEVTVKLASLKNALFVPSAAIKRVQGKTGVWRVDEGKARLFPVTIGVQTPDGRTQILAGLKSGDAVIVYSPVDLEEGRKVKAGKAA
jgi:HlyD family secretion protein